MLLRIHIALIRSLGLAPAPKLRLEQPRDPAAARQPGQGAVDHQPEGVVALGQSQRIGLEAQDLVRQPQPVAERALHQVVEQDGAVAEIGGELAAGQALQSVGVVRDRDHLGRDLGLGQRLAQAGLRGAAGEHADLLAGQLLEAGDTVDGIEQRRPGGEGEQREVHLGPAREGHGRGLAQDVGLAVRHGAQPVGGAHLDHGQLQLGATDLRRGLAGHGLAQGDAVAGGLAVGVREREGLGIVAVGDPQLAGLLGAVEHAGRGRPGDEHQHRRHDPCVPHPSSPCSSPPIGRCSPT